MIKPNLLRRVGVVVFDCDSTLVSIEGIAFLARDHAEEVERLTRAAMDGAIPLESVYGRRLALVRPHAARVLELAEAYVAALVPDARATVTALQREGIEVRILSGGLLPAVSAVAEAVGVPEWGLEAVAIGFDRMGAYRAFDESSPLVRSGGKVEVLERWRAELGRPMMLVGDGITDAEAAGAVDVFVAYAGVIERPAVVEATPLVIRSASLAPVLPLALAGRRPSDHKNAALYERGLSMLGPELRTLIEHTYTAGH